MISLDDLYTRDDGMCRIGTHPIKRDQATRDYIVPKAAGGSEEDDNVQLVCLKHNRAFVPLGEIEAEGGEADRRAVVKSFRVSTRRSGRRRIVRVSVYAHVERLREVARMYTETGGYAEQQESFTRALGVTHSVDIRHIGADGSETRSPVAAHIRLCEEALGTGVITHEATHAALAIYEQDCLEDQGAVHDGLPQEEALCYLVGDLASKIVNKLYEFNYYPGK